MLLRILNEAGIQQMAEFLGSLTTDEPQDYPESLLTDEETSEPIDENVDVERIALDTRLAAAVHLFERLAAAKLKNIEHNRGLWAWLALFHFEELCPVTKGVRKPGERARWIPETKNDFRYYRHLLAGPYLIYRAHQAHISKALGLLGGPLSRPGEVVAQIAARAPLITSPAVIETATNLYWDHENKKYKRGAQSKGAGTPRRLREVLNQFEVTWDLYSMSADELLERLPAEFNRFRPTSNTGTTSM